MKRPSFQFYPADLRANVKLRRCSWAARGVWLEIMCLFHDSDEYGMLRWTLEEIAQAVGCPKDLVSELVEKGVLKGAEKVGDKVSFSESFSQRNAPSISVVLIDNQPAPLWYSSRMMRDEHVRSKRGVHGTKSQENHNVPRKKEPRIPIETDIEKDGEKSTDKDTFSPSPTSSSSSSSLNLSINQPVNAGEIPKIVPMTDDRRFRMFPGWKPSDHVHDMLALAVIKLTADQLGEQQCEFNVHWLTQNTERSQDEWDKAFVQNCIFKKNKPRPPTHKNAQAPPVESRHLGFNDRAYSTENMIEDEETGGYKLGQYKKNN